MSEAIGMTAHGAMRMSQRGVGTDDIEMIMRIGTKVEGGYLVLEQDYQAFEREQKQYCQHARRLVGKRLVVEGDQVVVTAYHADRGKLRRLLRRARGDSLA
jgi:ribosomal 50S subunit-associated protein YjgA (DUF615 family)